MGHTIRLAVGSDAKAINVVSKHLGYPALSDVEVEDDLRQLLESAHDEVYVAEANGRVVGWLHLCFVRRLASANYYEIGNMVVDGDAQRQGIGRALIEHVSDLHPEKIRVRSNELRVETHQFYEAMGFEVSKVQRVFEKQG